MDYTIYFMVSLFLAHLSEGITAIMYVHKNKQLIRGNSQRDAHLFSLIYSNKTILYMFRTNNCSSSGGQFCTRSVQYFSMHLCDVQVLTLLFHNFIRRSISALLVKGVKHFFSFPTSLESNEQRVAYWLQLRLRPLQ